MEEKSEQNIFDFEKEKKKLEEILNGLITNQYQNTIFILNPFFFRLKR